AVAIGWRRVEMSNSSGKGGFDQSRRRLQLPTAEDSRATKPDPGNRNLRSGYRERHAWHRLSSKLCQPIHDDHVCGTPPSAFCARLWAKRAANASAVRVQLA